MDSWGFLDWGDLKQLNSLCEFTNQIGYISANVEYTILSNTYKTFNIFRILDEITASIKAIKKELKKEVLMKIN